METAEIRFHSLNIVLLYDPISVHKIPLDPIKTSTPFTLITLLPDEVAGGALILGSDPLKLKATLQSNRVEYIDENDTPFTKRSLEPLGKLLNTLPLSLSVRSIGMNFFIRTTPVKGNDAGKFLAEHYVKDNLKIEQSLGQPIFSVAIRLFLGTLDCYRDLRFTPVDLTGKEFILQYHLHKEIHIVETEKLLQTVNQSFFESWKEFDQWIEKLP